MKQLSYHLKNERGQAFMELAISLMFLLILLTVMLDLGFALYQMIAMRDATQEAAAYGSMCPLDETLIRDRLVKSASSPLDINDISNVTIEFINSSGTVLGPTDPLQQGSDSIRISLTVQHQIVVPFVETFIGTNRYPLTVTVADTILRTENTGCN